MEYLIIIAGMSNQIQRLEKRLDSFDPMERREALERLTADYRHILGTEGTNINMHIHSFFSYNTDGYSPSRIAWEMRKAGLYAAGLCDFDVLDGLEEFIHAGLMLGLRTSVNLETRAYLKEYADVDITSPGEHGVTYIMGAGFARELPEDSLQAKGLKGYRERARMRNVELVERINSHLPDIAIDYEKDVLPLTPTGSATERHIVRAYINKANLVFEHTNAEFWSKILERSLSEGSYGEETSKFAGACPARDAPALEEAVRAKLVKRGGIGYKPPSVDTFPPVDEFIDWVASCGAIPMITWLDGTSEGEKDGRAMLECMKAKGAAALNIVPDRNWNISDSQTRAVKISYLENIVETADDMGLPINIGTEMNRQGLPFVDDLDCEALRQYKEVFLRGARIMVGHTLLLRYAFFSYISEKAEAEFGGDVSAKNAFFEAVGKLPPLEVKQAEKFKEMGEKKALAWFRDAVGKVQSSGFRVRN